MKKIIPIGVMLLMTAGMMAQNEDRPQPTKLNIRTAYAFQAETLLISPADLDCTFFISPGMDRDVRIIGAEQQDLHRTMFTTGDRLVINIGSEAGVKEGDLFRVVSRGRRVPDPHSVGSLGVYHRYRGQVKAICVFPRSTVVELTHACSPVEVGHLVEPYTPREPLYRRSLKYVDCRVPETGARGRVVYLDIEEGANREIAAHDHMLAVNLGRDLVRRGDFLLFYKILKPDLPPVIVGTGIVVNPQNTNSTVKVLDSAYPVEMGQYAVLLPRAVEEAAASGEEIPILETLKEGEAAKDAPPPVTEFNAELLFPLDSAELSDPVKADLDRAAEFVKDKSEYMVVLKGYACSIGDEEYNLKLSERRVKAVREYLQTQHGIGDEFFDTHYYGESDAAFDNSVEAERRRNRRVTLQILAK